MLDIPQFKKPTHTTQRIAFLGPMCSGKTWAADYLVENYGYRKISFATKLKSVAYDLYGVNDKSAENRKLLQELGQDLRKHDPDVWIKQALYEGERYNQYTKNAGMLVIDDLRYENEAKVLKRNGFMLIAMMCDYSTRQERISTLYPDYPKSIQEHDSEQEWGRMTWDHAIVSDGYNTMADLDELLEPAFEGAT